MRNRAMATAMGAAVLLAAGAQPVLAADRPSGKAVATAIQHAVNGKATAADLEIIKNDPQLSRSVPVSLVPGTPTVTKAAAPTGETAEAARMAPGVNSAASASYQQICRAVDYPLTLWSYLGSKVYTWHHKFSWCTANQISGNEATRVITHGPYSRMDYFTDKSSVVYPQGLLTDAAFAPGGSPVNSWSGYGSPYYSHMARSVNLCFAQWSCYASNLPQSKLTIGRDNVWAEIASAG